MIDPDDPDCDDEENMEIPVPNVKGDTLRMVCRFVDHYASDPFETIQKPLRKATLEQTVPKWYSDFMEENDSRLEDIILAANFMDIQPLLSLALATLAFRVRKMTPEECKAYFLGTKNKQTDASSMPIHSA